MMLKLNFHQSVLKSSVSHDSSSEIILICLFGVQETFLIITNFENIYAAASVISMNPIQLFDEWK